jgi:hypothetical protein
VNAKLMKYKEMVDGKWRARWSLCTMMDCSGRLKEIGEVRSIVGIF